MILQDQESHTSDHSDDVVLPFRVVASGINGRIVRLGAVVDTILSRHDYPEPVARVLGEALVLAGMLGVALKFQSRLILQTKTDGPIDFLVVDYKAPGSLRGYASFDEARVKDWSMDQDNAQGALLGTGHMAMTIDPGKDMARYQGVVALENCALIDAAHSYFRQSEQLPTFAKVAIAKHYSAGAKDGRDWHWRAGGLIVQNLTQQGGIQEEDAEVQVVREAEGRLFGEDSDDWERVRLLASTVEDHELIDPMLSAERLLYRLFHEEGVRTFDARRMDMDCQCSRERIENMIEQFSIEELNDMLDEDGNVVVTCEFCKTSYKFENSA